MSSDQIAALGERGWIRSLTEGMWEHPDRVRGPVSLPEALETEFGEQRPGPDDEAAAD
jgi:hypothetical protein